MTVAVIRPPTESKTCERIERKERGRCLTTHTNKGTTRKKVKKKKKGELFFNKQLLYISNSNIFFTFCWPFVN